VAKGRASFTTDFTDGREADLKRTSYRIDQ